MTWLDRLTGRAQEPIEEPTEGPRPLRHLADEMGLSRGALIKAAQQGRLAAEKRGHFWFCTREAIEQAIAAGYIRG